MHSFLIASKNKKNLSEYINEFLQNERIDFLDRSMNFYDKAMGIEDVRNVQKKILFKPFKGKTKAVVIDVFEGITLEAQNALLKVLEEPPANTIIIISIPNKKLLLPTILSRCKIIELNENKQVLSNEEITQLLNYSITLFQGTVNDKLKLAQDITKSEDAAVWLEKMVIFVRGKLIENPENIKYLNFLKSLQKTYKILKSTNVSKRPALENLFLSF